MVGGSAENWPKLNVNDDYRATLQYDAIKIRYDLCMLPLMELQGGETKLGPYLLARFVGHVSFFSLLLPWPLG